MTRLAPAAIGIIVLAAGSGKRFGADKRQALMGDGRTLLATTLNTVPASISKRVLVLKPGEQSLARQFSEDWQICFAANPDAGMANSLASGITAATDWAGALIGLGDMPHVMPATYTALQDALCEHGIVIPTCNGRRGNPVGFNRAYFGEISKLAGDQGARSLLQAHANDCHLVETGDEGILKDVDEPGGLT